MTEMFGPMLDTFVDRGVVFRRIDMKTHECRDGRLVLLFGWVGACKFCDEPLVRWCVFSCRKGAISCKRHRRRASRAGVAERASKRRAEQTGTPRVPEPRQRQVPPPQRIALEEIRRLVVAGNSPRVGMWRLRKAMRQRPELSAGNCYAAQMAARRALWRLIETGALASDGEWIWEASR